MSPCVLPKPRISLLTQDERKNAEHAIHLRRAGRMQAVIKKENIRQKQQEKVLRIQTGLAHITSTFPVPIPSEFTCECGRAQDVNTSLLEAIKTVRAALLSTAAKSLSTAAKSPTDPRLSESINQRAKVARECKDSLVKSLKNVQASLNNLRLKQRGAKKYMAEWHRLAGKIEPSVAKFVDPDIKQKGEKHLEHFRVAVSDSISSLSSEEKVIQRGLVDARHLLDHEFRKKAEFLRDNLLSAQQKLFSALDDVDDAEYAKKKAERRDEPVDEVQLRDTKRAAQKAQRSLRTIIRMFSNFTSFFPELEAGKPAKLLAGMCNVGDTLPRKTLFDFEIIEEKHANDRGVVVLYARRIEDGRDVVLKGFPYAEKRRLERELTRVYLLPSHPFIVPYHAVVTTPGDSRGLVYIEMPRYDEGTLTDWLEDLDNDDKRKLSRQLLQAVEAIHKAKIIHKDIKPDNILMSGRGGTTTIALTDFDISHTDAPKNVRPTTTVVHGTVGYMAPELLKGTVATAKSDMYSVGATLYEMHFGEPPVSDSINKKTANTALNNLIHGLLDKDPAKRPSASECLRMEYFTALEGLRECDICCDFKPRQLGIFCDSKTHFFCSGCFADHVRTQSQCSGEQMEQFRQRRGEIVCDDSCDSQPFPLAQIYSCVPKVFDLLMKARKKLCHMLEQERAQRQMAQTVDDMRAQIEADVLRVMEASEKERMQVEVQRHKRLIEERILNLACPRCNQVFGSYEGCAALICSRCDCRFCALCLKDCGSDAHTHVTICDARPSNMGTYHCSNEMFETVQKKRRQRKVEEYFKTKVDIKLRGQLYEALKTQLRECGIKFKGSVDRKGITREQQIHADERLAREQQIQADERLARHLAREAW